MPFGAGPTSGANANSASGANAVAPFDRAKLVVAGVACSEKDSDWLDVRIENFWHVYEHRIEAVAVKDVCDDLERMMRKGQADWQVQQSLDAVGSLSKPVYQRGDIGVPRLREAWGVLSVSALLLCRGSANPGAERRPVMAESLLNRRHARARGDRTCLGSSGDWRVPFNLCPACRFLDGPKFRSFRSVAGHSPAKTSADGNFPTIRLFPAVYTSVETRYICSAPQPDNGVRLGV